MGKISVVIPFYNNIKGLTYLLDYFLDKDYPVIVVLNDESSFEKMKLKNKNFLFLPQKKNLGFAKAVNLGGEKIKTEWMLILNDDIEFKYQISNIKNQKYISKIKYFKNPLGRLLNFAVKNNLDAVSPVLVSASGEIENVGYQVLPYGKIKLFKDLASLQVEKLDGLTAACLLIKTEVFKKLAGFDESFFAYLEDVDFFLRFKKKNFKMAVAPLAVLHHHLSTSKTMGSFKAWQDLINWWRLYFKHPDVFKFDFKFLLERLKNLSGYLKAKKLEIEKY